MADKITIPAGAVLPYAGTYGADLAKTGWLLCDGTSIMPPSLEPTLFQAIGTCNGGDGVNSFSLPNYCGVFLRGVSAKSDVDPDAESRKAAAAGGAFGNACGSIQGYATAIPTTGLETQVINLPNDSHWAYHAGAKVDVAVWEELDQEVVSSAGGDAESRPVNIYVDFIIQKGVPSAVPVGALVPMTLAVEPGDGWMLCDGRSLDIASYSGLFSAISRSHGGGDTTFNLPDLRGMFLRGRAGSSTRDPDAETRGPGGPGGNQGNEVGSSQKYATGKPIEPFKVKLPHLPRESGEVGNAKGHDESEWADESTPITFFSNDGSTGGDVETRPVNLSVDWYIRVDGNPSDLPVGAIVAFAGSQSPGKGWLRCDGSEYEVSLYKELYARIGTLNGGDGSHFRVPDCRGRFLRGVSHGTGRDPEAATRQAAASGGAAGDRPGTIQSWASAPPQTSITGLVPHLPCATKETAKGSIHTGVHAAARNRDATSVVVEERSGDAETRPVNIYVEYWIKASS